jgi:leucyl aminopeptidase
MPMDETLWGMYEEQHCADSASGPCARAGEKLWRMPMDDALWESLKGSAVLTLAHAQARSCGACPWTTRCGRA